MYPFRRFSFLARTALLTLLIGPASLSPAMAQDASPAIQPPTEAPATPVAARSDRQKQLVLISFDGAGPNPMWQRSRDFARAHNAHFTYFLSCSLLIPRASAKTYQGPHQKPGRSNIGFAQTEDEARERLDHIWQAHLEGHDIASHTCGHFDGKEFSTEDWLTEMTTFRSVLTSAWRDRGIAEREPEGWKDFVAHGITGFRAPYFSVSPGMLAAEKQAGFKFDASDVTKGPAMPEQKDGLVRFGLPLIPEGPSQRPIIAMDYNLYVRHSNAAEDVANAATYEARAYTAFRAAFDKQYHGDRIPLQIGLHFVAMNGGAYWNAMERLAAEVCGKTDVACVTYPEAIAMVKARKAEARGSGL